MGDIPTATNTTATDINTIVKVAGGTIVSVAETMIIADVPFLGFPVVKQLWEIVFEWIASYFIKAAENGATFTVIDLQVSSEESGISNALAALVAAEKSGDPNAIKTAIQNYANAQSSLVHSDGSAPAQ